MIQRSPSANALLGTLFFAVFLAAAIGRAQEPDAAEPVDVDLHEQSIYIPYEKLQETFEKNGRGVFVPYERFQELWKAAQAAHKKPDPVTPPSAAVVTEIDNVATVEDQIVRVAATITIDLLKDGWIKVPLRLKHSAILRATIDDEPARITADPEKGHELVLLNKSDEPTRITLQLEYARSFTKAPGENSVAFEPPVAPVNRWSIRVPEAGVKVKVAPMLAATEVRGQPEPDNNDQPPVDSNEQITEYLAFVGAAPEVRIGWVPQSEGASGLNALVSVQSQQRIDVTDGVTRCRATLAYDISRAKLPQMRIEVPSDFKVVNVIDANIRQWEVTAAGNTQTITATLFEPADTSQSVVLELEKFWEDDQPENNIVAPTVKALDVSRQRGIVVVNVAEGLRAEISQRSGLSQLDAQQLPKSLQTKANSLSFRYSALPFTLSVQVAKVHPRISVGQHVVVELKPRKLSMTLRADYDIDRAGIFEMTAKLPAGYEIRHVRGMDSGNIKAAQIDSYTLGGDDDTQLTINLSQKAIGRAGLEIALERTISDDNLLMPTGETSAFELAVPRITGEHITRLRGRLFVVASESLRVTANELQGLQPGQDDVDELECFDPSKSIMEFSHAGDDTRLAFTATRRHPQVTARQLLVTRVKPGVITYGAWLRFNIRYSGVKSLRIDVPVPVAESFHRVAGGLRERRLEPQPADVPAEYVAFALEGDAELIGAQDIRLAWESPVSDFEIGQTLNLAVPRLIPQNVDRAEGKIVLAKNETIDLLPTSDTAGLDPIDPQHDLGEWPTVPDAAAALEFHDDWKLNLTATRYQLQRLKQTSVEQAIVRSVITRSDRVAVQALYRMRSNRQRLVIQLPQSVKPGETEFDTEPMRINGQAVSLEQGSDDRTFYVPLAGRIANNEPFLLELRYTSRGNGARIEYPHFPDDPAIQQVKMIAYLPFERAYLGRRGDWTPEMRWVLSPRGSMTVQPSREVAGLIGQLCKGVTVQGDPANEFPVDGNPLLFSTLRPAPPDVGALRLTTCSRRVFDASVFLGMLALGIVLLTRPLFERLASLCTAVAGLVLLGVFLPTLTSEILRRPLVIALVLVLLLWLSHALLTQVPLWRDGIGKWFGRWRMFQRPVLATGGTRTGSTTEEGGSQDA